MMCGTWQSGGLSQFQGNGTTLVAHAFRLCVTKKRHGQSDPLYVTILKVATYKRAHYKTIM